MSQMTLAIGNKSYSSWSMRPWLVLRQAGISFEEVRIPLYLTSTNDELQRWSPSGKVPALHDGTLVVWDSLAICEYLAECFPEKGLWPDEHGARAVARAVSAEMHAGFAELRTTLPMNCRRTIATPALSAGCRSDIARVTALWEECRRRFGQAGPFLFGRFTIADAMFAPVVLRFATYGIALTGSALSYAEAVMELPAVQEWLEASREEVEVIDAFER